MQCTKYLLLFLWLVLRIMTKKPKMLDDTRVIVTNAE